jgi:DeoR-like protein with HTH domain
MEVNLGWPDVAKKINGASSIDTGWNAGEGLGMVFGGEGKMGEGGSAWWKAGNCTIIVFSSGEENKSLLELRTDGAPADEIALKTWEKLTGLLAQQIDPATTESTVVPLVDKDRKKKVKELFDTLTIAQITERLFVSVSTIRRDLLELGLRRRKK